jgi:hypothetical protein
MWVIIWESFRRNYGLPTSFDFPFWHLRATFHATVFFKNRSWASRSAHAKFRDATTFLKATPTFSEAPSRPSCFVRSCLFALPLGFIEFDRRIVSLQMISELSKKVQGHRIQPPVCQYCFETSFRLLIRAFSGGEGTCVGLNRR